MQDFAQAGTVFWSFNGGEPLVRPDLDALVRLASKLGMITTLVTNGVLLSDRIADVRDIAQVEISIDGTSEIHDALRGKGVYDKAIRGLDAAVTAGIRANIFMVVFAQNAHADIVDQLVRLAVFHKATFELQPAMPALGCDGDPSSIVPTRDQLERLAKHIKALKKQGAPIRASVDYLNSWTNPPKTPCKAGLLCGWLDNALRLAPCPTRADENVTYRDALDHMGPPLHPRCRKCRLHSYWEINLLAGSKRSAARAAIDFLKSGRLL